MTHDTVNYGHGEGAGGVALTVYWRLTAAWWWQVHSNRILQYLLWFGFTLDSPVEVGSTGLATEWNGEEQEKWLNVSAAVIDDRRWYYGGGNNDAMTVHQQPHLRPRRVMSLLRQQRRFQRLDDRKIINYCQSIIIFRNEYGRPWSAQYTTHILLYCAVQFEIINNIAMTVAAIACVRRLIFQTI